MALKTFKPVSDGLRQLVLIDRKELYKGTPVKKLTEGLKNPAVEITQVELLLVDVVADINAATE